MPSSRVPVRRSAATGPDLLPPGKLPAIALNLWTWDVSHALAASLQLAFSPGFPLLPSLRGGRCARICLRDASLGANTLTIANGHAIDALRFVLGDFSRVACMVSTQAPQWYETDTKRMVEVTSPDNVLVSGKLVRGAVASVHVAAAPWGGSGFRMEVYGREGTSDA